MTICSDVVVTQHLNILPYVDLQIFWGEICNELLFSEICKMT